RALFHRPDAPGRGRVEPAEGGDLLQVGVPPGKFSSVLEAPSDDEDSLGVFSIAGKDRPCLPKRMKKHQCLASLCATVLVKPQLTQCIQVCSDAPWVTHGDGGLCRFRKQPVKRLRHVAAPLCVRSKASERLRHHPQCNVPLLKIDLLLVAG